MPNAPTYLGTVQNVNGSTISIVLDENTLPGLSFVEGYGYRIGQVGSFVRIPIGYTDLYGVVSQVGAGAVPEKLAENHPYGNRWMTVQLIGEGQRSTDFSRGISQYPTIGDQVHLLTEKDLSKIYGKTGAKNYISVGHLASAESIPALVNIDKLVTRHSAIVGTTGSGKSTTVAGLISSLSDTELYPSSRILVFDIHGEYAAALKDKANIYKIHPNTNIGEKPLFIPYWAMSFDELMSVTLGDIDDSSRGQVSDKVVTLKKKSYINHPIQGVTEDEITVDTPIPFSIHELWLELYNTVNSTHTVPGTGQSPATIAYLPDERGGVLKGDSLKVIPPQYKPQNQSSSGEKIYLSGSNLNIRRQLNNLTSKLKDTRYDFLFRPGKWLPLENGVTQEDLDTLLKSWIGASHTISILDLSGIPISILTTLIGILLRIIYDALFWARFLSEGGRERPILMVLEEAHTYLGQGDNGSAAIAVKRIVKEGRKYGIGAMIVSQRPSEIDSTVLSQCGTIFAMRLSNAADRGHVTGAVSDNLEGLLSMLPVLRTGEAIIIGEAVNLPIRALIDPPPKNRRPDSYDPIVFSADEEPGGWNRKKENDDYSEMIVTWRRQDPRSPKIKTDW